MCICLAVVLSSGSAAAKVVISEVMWAGSSLSTADEWLEFTSTASGWSLSGWSLKVRNSKGELKTQFTFPAQATIAYGQYLLLSNYNRENSALNVMPDFVTTAISLPNNKLYIELRDANGALIDQVDDGIGKPMAGENQSGTGVKRSMQRLQLAGSGAEASNWLSAVAAVGFGTGFNMFGTPGTGSKIVISPAAVTPSDLSLAASGVTVSTGSLPPVYITEVLANPAGSDDTEWIEVANLGTGAVNLAGWELRANANSDRYFFPSSGSWLLPGQYLVLPKPVTGIGLSNGGETLTLLSGSRVADTWAYPEAVSGYSYGRAASGTLQPLCLPTQSAPNDFTTGLIPQIVIQSGETRGVKKVSLNLQAAASGASLEGATCQFNYGDGFTSSSCNPPSHTFSPGEYSVNLTVTSYCGLTANQSLPVTVVAVAAKKNRTVASQPSAQPVCQADAMTPVIISEFLPDPYGEEVDGEWIELFNPSNQTVPLCGLALDDGPEGSRPYVFTQLNLAPGQYLKIPRSLSKIALNNPGDRVRLLASGTVLAAIPYQKALAGETMALRSDGLYVWTPHPTPGAANKFRTATRRFASDQLVVSAALPNPIGKDAGNEWVEIANVTFAPIDLTGWSLDNKPGSSAPLQLEGTLAPDTVRRFNNLALVNSSDQARLLDPDGYLASILSWNEAIAGKIYRPPVFAGKQAGAVVTNVVDGDTLDVRLTDLDAFTGVPDALKRRWLGLAKQGSPKLRVRLIGIDTPETVHPSLPVQKYGSAAAALVRSELLGQMVTLEFDRELFDKYQRVLAYVYKDGQLIQSKLLQQGLAYAYTRFPFLRSPQFIAYEGEARQAKLGLWSNGEAEQVITLTKQDIATDVILETLGLELTATPSPGLVASGTVVEFSPSVSADVFVSHGSGEFMRLTGSILITKDTQLHAYAKRPSGTGFIMSDIISPAYILKKPAYQANIVISEAYPAPVKSGSWLANLWGPLALKEWLEIRNLTAQPVPLAGWQLSDRSHSVTLGADTVVPGSGHLVLFTKELGISLNNDGDALKLTSPDDAVTIALTYNPIKKGQSVAFQSSAEAAPSVPAEANPSVPAEASVQSGKVTLSSVCTTDVPTPYEQNICTKISKDLDTDGDFIANHYEQYFYSTDPRNPDTDSDGWLDGFEVAAGLDPLRVTTGSRLHAYLYVDFIRHKLRPKWQLYKRKGLVIKGAAYPFKTLQVKIPSLQVAKRAVVGSDGKWSLALPINIAAGVHPVHLQVVDAAGRSVLIPNVLSVALAEPYLAWAPKSRVAADRSNHTDDDWLWQRYQHVYASGSFLSEVTLPTTRQKLANRPWLAVKPVDVGRVLEIEMLVVGSLLLGALRFLRL